MINKIVLASGNQGKLQELRTTLADLSIQVLSQSEFTISSAEETGLTFVENAILKARHVAKHTGLPALADDSGLEVDALMGRPGIYSARFAGIPSDDNNNNEKLLAELKDVPEPQRTARFQCVIVLMRHETDPTPIICQGTWLGKIMFDAKGNRGFGYDPLFYAFDAGCRSSELSTEQKNNLSHRGKAVADLIHKLRQE